MSSLNALHVELLCRHCWSLAWSFFFVQGRGRKEEMRILFILCLSFQEVAGTAFGPGNDCSVLALFQYSLLATQAWFFGFCPSSLNLGDALGRPYAGYQRCRAGACSVPAATGMAEKPAHLLTSGQLRSSLVIPDTAWSSGLKSCEPGNNLQRDADSLCARRVLLPVPRWGSVAIWL